jgi:hypothetical protein
MKNIKLSCENYKLNLKNNKPVTLKCGLKNNLTSEGSFENTTKTRLVYTYNDGKWYGGFEGFEGFKTYADITDEMAHSGSQSLKADFRNRMLMKRVDVEPHTDYVFSFYYYMKSDAESHKTPLWNFVSVGSANIRYTVCNGEWWMGKNLVVKYFDGHRDDGEKTVHTSRFYNKEKFLANKEKLLLQKRAKKELIAEAVKKMALAKDIHDRLEEYYIKATDFDIINDIAEKILSSIK